MLRTNTVFCCHRNEIIARLKEDFGYETRLPLTGPIAIVESTDDESLDQIGGCLLTENASHGLQTSKVIITYTGNLADVFLHGQSVTYSQGGRRGTHPP